MKDGTKITFIRFLILIIFLFCNKRLTGRKDVTEALLVRACA